MILILVFCLVFIELSVVAWIDLKTKKISNKWILVNLVASILLHIAASSLYPFSWEVLIFPVGFIVIGFFLYLLHVMGAGDSKFLASLFLIIPLEFHLMFFEYLVYSSIAIGVLLFLKHIYKNGAHLKAYLLSQYWAGIKQTLKSSFSYAPVILVAWIILGFNIWK